MYGTNVCAHVYTCFYPCVYVDARTLVCTHVPMSLHTSGRERNHPALPGEKKAWRGIQASQGAVPAAARIDGWLGGWIGAWMHVCARETAWSDGATSSGVNSDGRTRTDNGF